MVTNLEVKLAAKGIARPVPVDVIQEILRTVASIEYGSVEIIIHEGKVVQIRMPGKNSRESK